ncbi:MAG TPA: MBL fold metallo-hydrolase [Propionibacteriaceae bacterium]|nr:MBL fold metallo-hydrolase [Propionibacteriaceae bacterium]
MSFFFRVLASGSKGNLILVGTGSTRVLVDAGLSGRRVCACLQDGAGPQWRPDALLLSHEHGDHAKGVGVVSRMLGLPVLMTRGTHEQLPASVGRLTAVQLIAPDAAETVGDLRVTPFRVSHDAAEPVGFVIEAEGCRLGICTDLGVVTPAVRQHLAGCHALVLEANHDVERLVHGPYPRWLVERIRGPFGHLCNAASLDLLLSLYHTDLQAVVFAHLSEINNRPGLVSACVQPLRDQAEWRCVRFEIAGQDAGAPGIDL